MPRAILMGINDEGRILRPSGNSCGAVQSLSQCVQHLLRLLLLRGVALLDDLVQELARAVLVAHLLVRLGEVELGSHLLPAGVYRRTRRLAATFPEVEADPAKVDAAWARRGLRRRRVELEVEPATARRCGLRLRGWYLGSVVERSTTASGLCPGQLEVDGERARRALTLHHFAHRLLGRGVH